MIIKSEPVILGRAGHYAFKRSSGSRVTLIGMMHPVAPLGGLHHEVLPCLNSMRL